MGELAKARDLLNVGIREAPSLVDIYLASANVELLRGKFNRAHKYLNAASDIAEPSQEYISLVSRYYVMTGQVQKARSAISSRDQKICRCGTPGSIGSYSQSTCGQAICRRV